MRIPKMLKVLYSPSKVFKELAEKPNYVGVLLILILFITTNIFSVYVRDSKIYRQEIKPEPFEGKNDEWTENADFWYSNGECKNESDHVYGEYSIACTIANKSELWMQINLPESINCSSQQYNETSFSLKLSQNDTASVNILLILLSEAGYFQHSLENITADIWNNITISLGGEGWERNGEASWDSINGIRLLARFSKNVNATLFLDAFFFRGQYEPLSKYFVSTTVYYGIYYFILFLIFGGLLYILTKIAEGKLAWKDNFVVSSYSLTSLFIQGLFLTALFLVLPEIRVPRGVVGEIEMPSSGVLILTLASFSQLIFFIWSVIISTFAVRVLNDFSTSKAAIVSLAAYWTSISLAPYITTMLFRTIFPGY